MRAPLLLVVVLAFASACPIPPPELLPGGGQPPPVIPSVCFGDAVLEGPSVENLAHLDVLHHNLAIVTGAASGDVVVTGADGTRIFPTVAGRYRALVPLAEGCNDVQLNDDSGRSNFGIVYGPDENERFVRTIYVDASDGDGTFDAMPGEPNDRASAHARLSTAMWLLQAFTAETLFEEGFGRRTFRLELDEDEATGVARPRVEDFTSTLTMAEAHARDGNTLWSGLYEELAGLPQRDLSKDVVVMAMTRWDAETQTALAHTALGGDRLGLFGSGTLHTYAESLDGVVAAFNDETDMDTSVVMDDSAFRDRYWANYATGMGATLHELGHCLSLPHPANGEGVMSRGFDHVNRKLVMEEPASATSAALSPVEDTDEVGWDRSAAVRLAFHPFLAQRSFTPSTSIALTVTGDELVIASSAGVREVTYQVNGDAAAHDEHLEDAPTSVTISVAELRGSFPAGAAIHVSAIDDEGNIGDVDVP